MPFLRLGMGGSIDAVEAARRVSGPITVLVTGAETARRAAQVAGVAGVVSVVEYSPGPVAGEIDTVAQAIADRVRRDGISHIFAADPLSRALLPYAARLLGERAVAAAGDCLAVRVPGSAGAAQAAEPALADSAAGGCADSAAHALPAADPGDAPDVPDAQRNRQSAHDTLFDLFEAKNYAAVVDCYELMKKASMAPSREAYNCILFAAAQAIEVSADASSAYILDVYRAMLAQDVSPDAHTSAIVVSTLAKRYTHSCERLAVLRRSHARNRGHLVPRSLRGQIQRLRKDPSLAVALDVFYNTATRTHSGFESTIYDGLLEACLAGGELQRARTVLSLMRLAGRGRETYTVATYVSVIRLHGRAGKLALALAAYQDYVRHRPPAADDAHDARVQAAVIEAYFARDNWRGAMKFLDGVLARQPAAATHNSPHLRPVYDAVVDGYVRIGRPQAAWRWLQNLMRSRPLADAWTPALAGLLAATARPQHMRDAKDIYSHLVRRADFDGRLWQARSDFLMAHVAAGHVAAVRDVVRDANVRRIGLDLASAASACLLLAAHGDGGAAVDLFMVQLHLASSQGAPALALAGEIAAETFARLVGQRNAAGGLDEASVLRLADLLANIPLQTAPKAVDAAVAAWAHALWAGLDAGLAERLKDKTAEKLLAVHSQLVIRLAAGAGDARAPAYFGALVELCIGRNLALAEATKSAVFEALLRLRKDDAMDRWQRFVRLQGGSWHPDELADDPRPAERAGPPPRDDRTGQDEPAEPGQPGPAADGYVPPLLGSASEYYRPRTAPDARPSYFYNDALSASVLRQIRERAPIDAIAESIKFNFASRHSAVSPDTIVKFVAYAADVKSLAHAEEMYKYALATVPTVENDVRTHYMWCSVYNSLIGAHLRRDVRMALYFKDKLLALGGVPDSRAYAHFIMRLWAKDPGECADAAVSLFQEARERNVAPTTLLYNVLLSKLGRARRVDAMAAYVREMDALGVRRTSATYAILISAHCAVHDGATAAALFDEMERSPFYSPRISPLNKLMAHYVSVEPDHDRALYYYRRIQDLHLEPTSTTRKLLSIIRAAEATTA
ncbi:uncharacterized protein V1510DRAFT_436064 [Dipodascopsis tothii]|uniref:uncharacterized protein n=1 Tax=Dipodascopsis tothii TaxID=44089 RepID=UPI0034CEDC2E